MQPLFWHTDCEPVSSNACVITPKAGAAQSTQVWRETAGSESSVKSHILKPAVIFGQRNCASFFSCVMWHMISPSAPEVCILSQLAAVWDEHKHPSHRSASTPESLHTDVDLAPSLQAQRLWPLPSEASMKLIKMWSICIMVYHQPCLPTYWACSVGTIDGNWLRL